MSSVVGGRVEVCLRRISRNSVNVYLWWVCLDPVFVRLHTCVYRLDPSDPRFFISDGCCSGLLVLSGLSTATFRLPTTKRFSRLRWGRGDDAGATLAHLVLAVISKWSMKHRCNFHCFLCSLYCHDVWWIDPKFSPIKGLWVITPNVVFMLSNCFCVACVSSYVASIAWFSLPATWEFI